LHQFAAFLEEIGMNLRIPKVDDAQLTNYLQGMDFRKSIEALLTRVRKTNSELKKRLKTRVTFDYDKNGVFLGIYHKKSKPYFYIGVLLREKEEPRYDMLIEAAWPHGVSKKKTLEKYIQSKLGKVVRVKDYGGRGGFRIQKPIQNAYNGDAEKIAAWLGSVAVLVSRRLWGQKK
jgi:hypothetical protein